MKEFELTLKLRNNCLKARRLALGMSVAELASAAGVNLSTVYEYEGLALSPIVKKSCLQFQESVWKPSAQKLADFHGVSPDVLWPDAVLAVRQSKVVTELDSERALALAGYGQMLELPPTPEELVEQLDTKRVLSDALSRLNPRHRLALERTIDGATLKKAGEELGGVCRERVRQMNVHSLRLLREYLKGEL